MFEIDYQTLTLILNFIFNFKTDITLNIKKANCKSNYSAYYNESKTIRLFLPSTENLDKLKYIVGTILHEIQHYFHFSYYRDYMGKTYDTYQQYHNSPEEKDARKAEKLTSDVCSAYMRLCKLKERVKSVELNCFKELEHNILKIENENI